MRTEYHITVEGDPVRWYDICEDMGIKPLWIELSTFERQLMCAITGDDLKNSCVDSIEPFVTDIERRRRFKVIRIKHEVGPRMVDVTTLSSPYPMYAPIDAPPADFIYAECHMKFDGEFRGDMQRVSRDLYRENRWYVTQRLPRNFDPSNFLYSTLHTLAYEREYPRASLGGQYGLSTLAGWEFEYCLSDTNPKLDERWMNPSY